MATISVSRFKRAVQRDLKNFGLLNTVKDYAFRAVNQITVFSVFHGMMIDRVNPKFMEADQKYECRFLNPDEILAFSQRLEFDLSEKFVRAAIKKGDECYAILDGNILAAYGWYSNKPTMVNDELRLRFDRKYIYLYNTFTHADYRGQRLNAVGMTRGLNEYLKRGIKGSVFCVEGNNHRSLRSSSRMGSLGFGKIIALKLFGKYFIYHSPGCKGHRFIMKAV